MTLYTYACTIVPEFLHYRYIGSVRSCRISTINRTSYKPGPPSGEPMTQIAKAPRTSKSLNSGMYLKSELEALYDLRTIPQFKAFGSSGPRSSGSLQGAAGRGRGASATTARPPAEECRGLYSSEYNIYYI